MFVDEGSFFFAAARLGLVGATELPPSPPRERRSAWSEMGEGLRIVAHHPVLRALTGTTATVRFFGGFVGTSYWLFLVRDLGLSPAIVGVSIGIGGVGAFLGALVAGRLTRR